MNAKDNPIWLFDLGNSRLKAALLIDKELAQPFALEWDTPGFGATLRAKLAAWPVPLRVLIASVASPTRAENLRVALRAWLDVDTQWLRSPREGCGIFNSYRIPERLGIDRFLAMAAAHAAAGGNAAIVIGCGTALTLDAVDAQGMHRNGLIAPSPSLMIDSLRRATAIEDTNPGAFDEPARIDDTGRAIEAGCTRAAASLVEWFHTQQRMTLGDPCLWLHGGGAMSLRAMLEEGNDPDRIHNLDDAVLRGLAIWANSLTPSRA